jgi:hypothetical protein
MQLANIITIEYEDYGYIFDQTKLNLSKILLNAHQLVSGSY